MERPTEERYIEDQQGKIATAREFNIPLWYVDINEICYRKGIEWFYFYYGENSNEEDSSDKRL